MISDYIGHFNYSKIAVSQYAPDNIGVYYCGHLGSDGKLYPDYIGRAMGDGVSIRSRLYDHLRTDYWPAVTHFGYRNCSNKQEAETLEANEIERFKPKYNTQLKSTLSMFR